MSAQPSASAASRNTRSGLYQCTDQPRASAAEARASRYMTESATVCARLSAIRSSIVCGSLGQILIRDARNRQRNRYGQRLEALARAARGGRSHALDERHGVSERNCLGSRGV